MGTSHIGDFEGTVSDEMDIQCPQVTVIEMDTVSLCSKDVIILLLIRE